MAGLDQAGVDLIREHMAHQQRRYLAVQRRDVGQAAAQHDDVGVEDVEDLRGDLAQALARI